MDVSVGRLGVDVQSGSASCCAGDGFFRGGAPALRRETPRRHGRAVDRRRGPLRAAGLVAGRPMDRVFTRGLWQHRGHARRRHGTPSAGPSAASRIPLCVVAPTAARRGFRKQWIPRHHGLFRGNKARFPFPRGRRDLRPEQWLAYQPLLARMERIYYFDVPTRYTALSRQFPEVITVKPFTEFFREKATVLAPRNARADPLKRPN